MEEQGNLGKKENKVTKPIPMPYLVTSVEKLSLFVCSICFWEVSFGLWNCLSTTGFL